MEIPPHQYCFSTMSDLVVTLGEKIKIHLSKKLQQQAQASLVVSGGNTPKSLYDYLSHLDLDWSRIIITLTDERWVETTDNNSNEWMIKNTLLVNRAKAAHWIGLKTQDATPEQAIEKVHARLQTIPKPYDVILLGMGLDGHTASLFPCADNIHAGLNLNYPYACIAMHPKQAPFARMSLSLKELNHCHQSIVLLQGQEKWTVYQKVLTQNHVADRSIMPIRKLLTNPNTSVYWSRQ